VGVSFRELRCESPELAILIHKQIFEEFLQAANSVRSIRPFLAEFPLTPHSFYLYLLFLSKEGEKFRPPYLSEVVVNDDNVLFNQFATPEEFRGQGSEYGPYYKIIKKIPISEASWLQEYLRPSVVRKKANHEIVIPVYSQISEWRDADFTRTQFEFLNKFCATNSLAFVTYGYVGEVERDSVPFGFALRGSQKIDLAEAKKLAEKCFCETMRFVRSDQATLDYMKKRSTWKNHHDPSTIPETRHLEFRISFWDENIDRQPSPYIAEIRVIAGKCKYFTADEGQRLVLVHEELLDFNDEENQSQQ
jgi:hypothetical protein